MADGDPPFAPKCALAVDVSAPDMLGDDRALFEACEARAVLDHHESNPFFGQVNHVEPERAAAGEMALLLIKALGVALTKDMASCLFAAISSDTGNFNYSNTTAETFEAAAACVRAGADVDRITGYIYRTRTEARTRLLGLALAELHREGKVAWACVTNAMFERAGALRCDTERIVNYLIEIEGVEIAALATEQEDALRPSSRCAPSPPTTSPATWPSRWAGAATSAPPASPSTARLPRPWTWCCPASGRSSDGRLSGAQQAAGQNVQRLRGVRAQAPAARHGHRPRRHARPHGLGRFARVRGRGHAAV